jgi:phosphoglycolate phosphatase-like HAD superfamily hydrolase
MPDAVLVFDLDGTLSDPLEGIGRSIRHSHAEHPHRLAAAPHELLDLAP